MTGQRQTVTLTWVHVLIAFYMLWLLLSFALGLRHAMPTANNIRQFAGSLLSVGLVFIVVDMLRDPILLRRLVVAILAAIGLQAIIAIGLYLIPDVTATNNLLNSLGRIGLPQPAMSSAISKPRPNWANARLAPGSIPTPWAESWRLALP
jgi:polysaccharide biosynthesis protein PslJ